MGRTGGTVVRVGLIGVGHEIVDHRTFGRGGGMAEGGTPPDEVPRGKGLPAR